MRLPLMLGVDVEGHPSDESDNSSEPEREELSVESGHTGYTWLPV